jgi:hypothetical protein
MWVHRNFRCLGNSDAELWQSIFHQIPNHSYIGIMYFASQLMGVRILWLYQYDRLCSLDICPGVWWQGLWLLCASAEGLLHQKPKVDRHVANLEIWEEFWYHLYILETLFYFWELLYTLLYIYISYIYNMYTPEITGEIAQWNAMQRNVILIYCHRL